LRAWYPPKKMMKYDSSAVGMSGEMPNIQESDLR
jgi:hypothetical protein